MEINKDLDIDVLMHNAIHTRKKWVDIGALFNVTLDPTDKISMVTVPGLGVWKEQKNDEGDQITLCIYDDGTHKVVKNGTVSTK